MLSGDVALYSDQPRSWEERRLSGVLLQSVSRRFKVLYSNPNNLYQGKNSGLPQPVLTHRGGTALSFEQSMDAQKRLKETPTSR